MNMNNPNNLDRLEELQVGFLLGDLSAEEETELVQLASKLGCQAYPDGSLPLTLAGLDASVHLAQSEDLPESIRERLAAGFPSQLSPLQILPRGENNLIEGPFGNHPVTRADGTRMSWAQWGGWAAAAAILCFWLGSEFLGKYSVQNNLSLKIGLKFLKDLLWTRLWLPWKGLANIPH
ncbi:MAG: hypothetical protein LR011_14155 [Verrucomicrobia bacterium]|nr:hypothetical protein [Verrucomicrobiota bacterium]